MDNYEKPMARVMESKTEGVYMASGDGADNTGENKDNAVKVKCRFGRTEWNKGSDTCQACSASNGTESELKGTYKEDFAGCIDNMPKKEKQTKEA